MAGPFALASDVKTKILGLLSKPLNTAADGQVLTADSSSSVGVSWKAPTGGSGGGSVSNATDTVNGVVRLAGDLAGTADAPTLRQIRPSSGTFGDSDSIPRTTVDQQGRVTAIEEVSIAVVPGSIPGLDEYVRDLIGATLNPGDGVSITADDANDRVTITAAGGGGGSVEPFLLSVRRQAADGTYPQTPAVRADTTLYWVGTSVPGADNPALEDGAFYSALDTST